jgi:hypothetical protein
MKQIQPISIWQNGQTKEATVLNAYVVSDNLIDTATFYYSLLTDNNEQLSEGNLTMSDEDYTGFVSNDYAYNWIAKELKLQIL